MSARLCLLLAIVCVPGACRAPTAPPLPLPLPHGRLAVRYLAAANAPAPRPPGLAGSTVRATLFATTAAVPGDSIEQAASSILSSRGAPFRATSSLPAGSCWLTQAQATNWLATTAPRARIDSAALVLDASLAAVLDGGPSLPRLECRLNATQDVEIRLRSTQTEPPREESVQVALPLGAQGTAILFVPSQDSVGYAGHALVLQHAGAAIAAELATARAAALPAAPIAPAVSTWQLAQRAIGEHNRRPALLALARAAPAARCIDVLLAADESALVAIGAEVALAAPPDAGAAGAFTFERAVWRGLLPQLERDGLCPGLQASVQRTLGAVAFDPATLRALVQTAGDAAGFTTALQAENLQALADRDAPVRSAAHEWLLANAAPVAGYDPFGEAAARRAALRTFQATSNPEAR